MRLKFLALAILALSAASSWAAEDTPAPLELKDYKEKLSYATGVMTARNLQHNEVEFDENLIIRGMRDAMGKGPIAMDEKELKLVLQSMQADMQRHMTNERQVKANINREKGVVFQKEYAKKPGVAILPGNLMYRVIKAGKGDRPSETGTVVVRYKGTLIDGTLIEETPEGKTVTLKMEDVMTGWREALKKMNAGSTWEIVVPPNMAYGARGSEKIGPNETLVFTLELVAVVQSGSH